VHNPAEPHEGVGGGSSPGTNLSARLLTLLAKACERVDQLRRGGEQNGEIAGSGWSRQRPWRTRRHSGRHSRRRRLSSPAAPTRLDERGQRGIGSRDRREQTGQAGDPSLRAGPDLLPGLTPALGQPAQRGIDLSHDRKQPGQARRAGLRPSPGLPARLLTLLRHPLQGACDGLGRIDDRLQLGDGLTLLRVELRRVEAKTYNKFVDQLGHG
jgi:hypothetical protein